MSEERKFEYLFNKMQDELDLRIQFWNNYLYESDKFRQMIVKELQNIKDSYRK